MISYYVNVWQDFILLSIVISLILGLTTQFLLKCRRTHTKVSLGERRMFSKPQVIFSLHTLDGPGMMREFRLVLG